MKRIPLEKRPKRELEKLAWEAFSKYVRMRDSQRIDDIWHGVCITCTKNGPVCGFDNGKFKWAKGWDAGHFISRGVKVIKFDEENVNLQCSFRCNKMKSGEHEKYKLALDMKYGDGTYKKLEALAKENPTHKFTREELIAIIIDGKEQIAWMTKNS